MAILQNMMVLLLCLNSPILGPGSKVFTNSSAVSTEGHCKASMDIEREQVRMTFTLRKDIDTTSSKFYAHVRRKTTPNIDIILCDGHQIQEGQGCEVKKAYPMFGVSDISQNTLTVRIFNVSRDFEDTYVLKVYFNNTAEPGINCTLNMTDMLATTTPMTGVNDDGNISDGVIAAIAIVVLLVFLALIVIFRKRIRKNCQEKFKGPRQDPPMQHRRGREARQDETDGHGLGYHKDETTVAVQDSPPPRSEIQSDSLGAREPLLVEHGSHNAMSPAKSKSLEQQKKVDDSHKAESKQPDENSEGPTKDANPLVKKRVAYFEKGGKEQND